jgi:uncharacterized protein YbjT (DUF2867 family)
MPRHAFILGGTGQIGRAIAGDLIEQGWHVTVAHRGTCALPSDLSGRGVKMVVFDREQPGELARAVRSGTDALIDTIAFGPDHARQLIEIQQGVGTLVVVSSASVYCDALGKTPWMKHRKMASRTYLCRLWRHSLRSNWSRYLLDAKGDRRIHAA